MGLDLTTPPTGQRLAYAEIAADFTTTVVYAGGITAPPAGSTLDALDLPVLGTGRPVVIKAYFGLAKHSTANQPVYIQFAVDDVITFELGGGAVSSNSTSVGRSLYVETPPLTIAPGVTKVITPIVRGGAAGTSTIQASAEFRSWIRAVTE